MIDYLISIPGPTFLVIYLCYVMLIIFLVKYYVSVDNSLNYPVPEPTHLQPLEIALLKKGIKGAVNLTLYNLWRKDAIKIQSYKNSVIIKQKTTDESEFNSLDQSLYDYVEQPRNIKHFYNSSSLNAIEKIIQPQINRLKDLKLYPEEETTKRNWYGLITGWLFIISLGGLKLYFGIIRNKPIVFLVLLLILSSILIFIINNPYKLRYTALGRKFLKNVETRFSYLKTASNSESLITDNVFLYAISIFGLHPFMATHLGSFLQGPFQLEKYSEVVNRPSGCSGGCGGGCSGGCSGGCGGGCGGCGGD